LACLKLTDHFGALLSGHAPIHALDFNLSVVFRHVWGIEMGVHLHLLTLLHTHTCIPSCFRKLQMKPDGLIYCQLAPTL